MEFELGYLLSLVLVGIGFTGLILGMILDEVSRKKAAIAFLLSFAMIGLGIYYYYVVSAWQKADGYPSFNRLNHHIQVYRSESPAGRSIIIDHMR